MKLVFVYHVSEKLFINPKHFKLNVMVLAAK